MFDSSGCLLIDYDGFVRFVTAVSAFAASCRFSKPTLQNMPQGCC